MEESKKSMPVWAIVLLSVLGTCVVGFCVWYGVNYFKGENKLNDQAEESVSQKEDTPIEQNGTNNLVEDLTVFNLKTTAIELDMIPSKDALYTNFENIKKSVSGVSLDYICDKYSEYEFEHSNGNIETKNACSVVKVMINNSVSFYHTINYSENIIEDLVLDGATIKKVISERNSGSSKTYVVADKLIYAQNYFIDFRSYCCGTDDNAFTIYDLNGKEKLNVGDVKANIGDGTMSTIAGNVKTVYNGIYNLKPIVVNSKLYYIEVEDSNNAKCSFKYVDLTNNLKLNTIKELDERCGQ